MNRMFIITVLICLSFLRDGVSAQEERGKAIIHTSTIPGEWELKPLAIEGAPAPGGGKFHFSPYVYLEYPFWVESGITAFWASPDPKAKNFTLYSIKNNKVTKILSEGDPLPVVGTDTAKVRRSYRFPPMQPVVPGKALLYINASESSLTAKSAVYTWDGEQLRLLLGNESKLEIDGVTYTVYRASASHLTPDGRVVINCESNKPWVAFSLIHDGVNLTPFAAYLVKEKKFLALGSKPPIEGDRELSLLQEMIQINAGLQNDLKNKLFPFSIGSPDPFEPTKKILSFSLIAADHKDSIAFTMNSSKNPEPILAIFQNGKFHKLFDKSLPGVKNKIPWRVYRIESGFFLDREAPIFFFKVTLYRKSEIKSYDFELVPHYFLFDGESVHNLWESALSTQSTRPVRIGTLGKGAFVSNGILLRGIGARGYRVFDNVHVLDTPEFGSAWLLEVNGKEFSFKPAPEFNVSGKKVSLGNVVGWKNPMEAIVRLEDGIYLLSRVR